MLLAAPIQGYTDSSWRIAHNATIGGIAEYYAPFLRLEKGVPRAKDLRDLANPRNPRPQTVAQILAATRDRRRR